MMADPKTVLPLLKTARGQIDGIIKMVEDDRYCMDISQQVMAVDAMLRKVNREILSAHLKHCVEHAEGDAARAEKIDEFVAALGKLI
ncbi:MAG: metal-sensing transcriptional repressor [Oscillospiraceae bacterium]|nr:metal-sensing transcriptional repressor [Oscillospiraceae bacterium]